MPAPSASPPPTLWRIEAPDGWSLALRSHLPGGPPRASILLSSGMMLDGRAMDRPSGCGLASFFQRQGYLATTLDLRGHGASRPRASRAVDWTFDELVALDIPAACRAVRERAPQLPLFWIGHSLSAHAGVVAAGLDPQLGLAGIVALCPGPWLRVLEPSALFWAGKRGLLAIWSALTRGLGYFPAAALGMGTNDESRSFVAQHRRWAKGSGWTSGDGEHDYLAALCGVEAPVLVIAAAGDLLCRPRQVERFAALLGSANGRRADYRCVDRAVLEERRNPGHMGVITSPPAGKLWSELEQWISDRIAAVKAG